MSGTGFCNIANLGVVRVMWPAPGVCGLLLLLLVLSFWHFVVQASLELKLTPDDILDEYKKKNEINRERQRNGY